MEPSSEMVETLGAPQAFMEADYNVPCTDGIYTFHLYFAYVMVTLIPLGIPLGFGFMIWRSRAEILEHKGPHQLR